MFGSLYFILIKYQLAVKLAMLELMCFVCVCVCVCSCARALARSLQLFPYTSKNAHLLDQFHMKHDFSTATNTA